MEKLFSFIPDTIRRARRIAELETDHQRTRTFLSQHGHEAASLDELRDSGKMLAVVDAIGGFFAFEGRGIEGELSAHFIDPERNYWASVSKEGGIEPGSEIHFTTSGGDGWAKRRMLGPGTLDLGVYTLHSQELVDRIREVFSNPQQEVRE